MSTISWDGDGWYMMYCHECEISNKVAYFVFLDRSIIAMRQDGKCKKCGSILVWSKIRNAGGSVCSGGNRG